MKIATIKYGKVLTSIVETIKEGEASKLVSIDTIKVSELSEYVNQFERLNVVLANNVVKKTVKTLEAAGFSVCIDADYGFEWESKIYANNYKTTIL